MGTRKYEHVIIIGVDGGGHFFKEADTPNFDRIFANGAVTYDALTSFPSGSGECWTSMVTGVGPYLHGCNNDILRNRLYPTDSAWPTLFRRIREAYPDAKLGAFCEWWPLVHGLVEFNQHVTMLNDKDYRLVEPVCTYIKAVKPDFLFVHCDSVDHVGHGNGYGTPVYLDQVHTVDGYIGQMYDAVKEAGMLDSTLLCVVCDHGGTLDKREDGTGFKGTHGGWSYNERCITFAATGKYIVKGQIGKMNIRDIAPLVMDAFGLEIPAFDIEGWTGQIPNHLVEGIENEYQDISSEKAAPPRISRVPGITELI